ncbi:MAG: hypothetical protein RM368_28215 [Nostoc sp. DedSLP03]|uniref:hypothetical protein n=1 Tax=Nostoc sp. DedSLP03 TaxID=3075400 RepID=UPI002AD4126F|nr:hypothetical protein [Nostoc sp. DedSLP03]MDZ7968790.1 hypothetical protein [Nostoc sp. DedSLP03]
MPTQTGEYSSKRDIEKSSALSTQIVEAQGWVVNAKGEVILTAAAPTPTPHSLRNLLSGATSELKCLVYKQHSP